ncbi:MAG: hypothetical protein U1E42_00385 [Rhodospirillales bacterium]
MRLDHKNGNQFLCETPPEENTTVPALVIFDDDTTLKWLRPLRPGFRHCFVAISRGDHWIICNPFSHYTDLEVVHGTTAAAMAEWFCHHGLRVVETVARTPPPRCAPLRPFTCVEVVKRTLGLRAPWVFTPRQLHRHLIQIAGQGHN